MRHISFRDILLLSLSAVLLNVSFAVAQPTQPPANGVLTPNFSGLNVTGQIQTGSLSSSGRVSASNVRASNIIASTYLQAPAMLIAGIGTVDGDLNVYEDLKTDTITARVADSITVESPMEVGQLETDIIVSKNDAGEPVRVNDNLYVQDQLQVNDMSYLSDLDVSGDAQIDGELNSTMGITSGQADLGSLRVSSISRSGNANNEIPFNSPINVSGRIEIDNTNILTYLKNRISFVQGPLSNSQTTYASCGAGKIAISCGSNTRSWSSRTVEVYRSTSNQCVARWASAAYEQSATAICFDY